MIPFIKAMTKLKAVYEWFNFANDTMNAAGLVKRAVAATAIAGGMVGVGVGAVKTVEVVAQSPQERAIGKAIATHAPDITPEIREQVIKVTATNTYSKMFLEEEKNRPILDAILSICLDGAALPSVQCADANSVKNSLDEEEAMKNGKFQLRGVHEMF